MEISGGKGAHAVNSNCNFKTEQETMDKICDLWQRQSLSGLQQFGIF